MGFNLATVEETNGSLYITPGIHNVVIEGFEYGRDRFENEIITIRFKSTDGSESLVVEERASEDVKEGKQKSQMDMTLVKIRHIARAIIGEENLSLLTGENVEELVASLNTNLVGKPYRQKFGGQEVHSNTKSWDKAVIPMPSTRNPMAESLSEEPTKLTYDKENPYDYRRKAITAVNVGIPTVPTGNKMPPHFGGAGINSGVTSNM